MFFESNATYFNYFGIKLGNSFTFKKLLPNTADSTGQREITGV